MLTSTPMHRPDVSTRAVANRQGQDDFAVDVLAALASRPSVLSPKYFYDEKGSALFDRICQLPEYYPTRTELLLLAAHADEIADQIGPGAEIIEFGAGSLQKIRLLLDALRNPLRYVPIDISGAHLAASAGALQRSYPDLAVRPVVADYTADMSWLEQIDGAVRRIGFFPGSTLGNLNPAQALAFLKRVSRGLQGGALLLGVDLVKDPSVLHAAYNDSKGVTAAFNLNVLARANRELDADFDLVQFAHSAFYNSSLRRIEMHLMSLRTQWVQVCGQSFVFEEGETLHTENSYKFTINGLHALAARAGFLPGKFWIDPHKQFCLQWLQAPA